MKKAKIVPVVVLLPLVTLLLLAFLQCLFVPKYMTTSKEGALTAEYYRDAENAHDVLFIGDCEVYECFTPPTLFEEYGITSYVRGNAQQLVWQSYAMLEDTLRYETPRAVVFNVLALKYGKPQNEAYNRMTLDGMEWSKVKIDAIRASMTGEESAVSYVFPLLRFHSRWKEISAEDWQYLFTRDTVSHNGYLMQSAVVPKTDDDVTVPLIDPGLPGSAMAYLDKMRELCTEKGIQLILVKAPTDNWRYHWYDEWEEQIVSYTEKYDLPYYNFIPLADEIGIDWSTDTYDGGVHLNVSGAEKLTSYFGKILSEEFGLEDRRTDAETAAVWNKKIAAYNAEKEKQKEE